MCPIGCKRRINLFRQTRNWAAYDCELAEKMSDLLVSFARTGMPRTGEVSMPQYNLRNEQRMDFGDSISIEKLNTEALDLLAKYPVPMVTPAAAPVTAPPLPSGPVRPSF